MSFYLLDTNICIHFTKNEYGIVEKLDSIGFDNCFISELTIAEILYGVANSAPTKQAANRQALNGLRTAFEAISCPLRTALNTMLPKKLACVALVVPSMIST
jgi:tRNA(fMet)-specific endonuclease VapC